MTTAESTTRIVSPFLAIASAPVAPPFQLDSPAAQAEPCIALQLGPTYECFLCGAPAKGIQYWSVAGAGFSPLDAYAGSIGYLIPTCRCHVAHVGCTRVAVLDEMITPLHLVTSAEVRDWNVRTERNVAAVRRAIELLTGLKEMALAASAEALAEGWSPITVEEELARR